MHLHVQKGLPLRFLVLACMAVMLPIALAAGDGSPEKGPQRITAVPVAKPSKGASYRMNDLPDGLYADIMTTKGAVVISLEFEKTPLTVINFTGLAEGKLTKVTTRQGQPFYDGLAFHRVIKDFMIQGGDPEGTGRGGPGYRFPDEIDPSLKHDRAGILSMANAGPGTNGSQFFITHVPTSWLDGKHTVFGHVVKGQDVVNSIAQGDLIQTVTIVRKGAAAEAFRNDQAAWDEALASLKDRQAKSKGDADKKIIAQVEKLLPGAKKTASGIRYLVDKEGSGGKPKAGQKVTVHYKGTFLDGRVFDSSYDRNDPLEVPIGVGNLIPGWDEIVLDMKVGEKRRIILPPEMAYGDQGAGGVIPPGAWLYFELELLKF